MTFSGTYTVRAVFRQEHETALVSAYLPEKGFFVEVGAFYPHYLSQTWRLEEAGWDGLLVEPIPEHAEALRRNRRARVYEVACGSYEHHGTSLPINVRGGLSSFVYGSDASIGARVVTLDWVLADAKVPDVDFLSIDVEGWEMQVLRGFSFSRYRPKLILLEDFADGQERHRYMVATGYKRVRRTGDNSWYIPAEVPFHLSWFGRWQLLRKYYLSSPIRHMKRFLRKLRNNR
jgi:FkbM family methyltransferase